MDPTGDAELTAAARRALAAGAPAAWSRLAATVARYDRLPPGISPGALLAALLAELGRSTAPGVPQLLEWLLPVRVPADTLGLPSTLALYPCGTELRRSLSTPGWVAATTLEVAKTPDARRTPATVWFAAVTHADHLCRAAREAGTIAPGWEISLFESGIPPYRASPETLRLVLTTRDGPSPELHRDRLYCAKVGTGRLDWFLFGADGTVGFRSGSPGSRGKERTRHEFAAGRTTLRGTFTSEGRDLTVALEGEQDSMALTGFLDARGRLCLQTRVHAPKKKGVRARAEDTYGAGRWELVPE